MKKLILLLLLLPGLAKADNCNSIQQKNLLALAMYHEARGEGIIGMQLVGEVILNRVESLHFPDTICSVINDPGQFTFARATPREQEPWRIAQSLAARLIDGDYNPIIPTALYFNPGGTRNLNYLTEYKNHTFYF